MTEDLDALRQRQQEKYRSEKHCCSVCDREKVCHVCGEQTLIACSDCAIDLSAVVYVCPKPACRDAHEHKCPAALLARLEAQEKELSERTLEKMLPQIAALATTLKAECEAQYARAEGLLARLDAQQLKSDDWKAAAHKYQDALRIVQQRLDAVTQELTDERAATMTTAARWATDLKTRCELAEQRLDAQQQAHHTEMNRLLAGFTEERAARQREFDEQFDRRLAVQQRLDAVTAKVQAWDRRGDELVSKGDDAGGWTRKELAAELAAVLTGEAKETK